jgi:hypothetical protein
LFLFLIVVVDGDDDDDDGGQDKAHWQPPLLWMIGSTRVVASLC